MVLERLENVRDALKAPWHMMIVGGVVSIIALVISFLISSQSIGMFTSFIITIAMMPFMVNLITYEETRETQVTQKGNIFQRHRNILIIYSAFFGGMLIALTMLFLLLPSGLVNKMFQDQINQVNIIRGDATVVTTFENIIVNNVGVLMLAFVFSFLFGAGAVFILAWNASVLATAIGMSARNLGGLVGLPAAFSMFLPHGILEIMAYFIGGIAGGLVSVALTRKQSKGFIMILKDSMKLLGAAVILLLIAGVIESSLIAVA